MIEYRECDAAVAVSGEIPGGLPGSDGGDVTKEDQNSEKVWSK